MAIIDYLGNCFIILSSIFWIYLSINIKNNHINKITIAIPLSFLFLIFVQLVIGAFVSGMDAGTIYNSWPMMGETYFPDDNKVIYFMYQFLMILL